MGDPRNVGNNFSLFSRPCSYYLFGLTQSEDQKQNLAIKQESLPNLQDRFSFLHETFFSSEKQKNPKPSDEGYCLTWQPTPPKSAEARQANPISSKDHVLETFGCIFKKKLEQQMGKQYRHKTVNDIWTCEVMPNVEEFLKAHSRKTASTIGEHLDIFLKNFAKRRRCDDQPKWQSTIKLVFNSNKFQQIFVGWNRQTAEVTTGKNPKKKHRRRRRRDLLVS